MEMTSCKLSVIDDATKSQQDAYVCCKFYDESMELLVIRGDDSSAFRGEVFYASLERYANSLNIQLDQYVSECKDIFSGQRTDIDFLLKKSDFLWKKKVIVGKIPIKEEENCKRIMQDFLCLVTNYAVMSKNFNQLKESSKSLYSTNEQLRKQLECLSKVKNDMEQDFYKKTIVLINKKKKFISEIKEKTSIKDTYSQDTESDTEVEEVTKKLNSKRSVNRNEPVQSKKLKIEISSHWLRNDDNSYNEHQVLSQESEEEMELKLEEDEGAIPSPTSQQNESEEIKF